MALRHMRGSYLCFCDADDSLPPRSIAARLEALLADPSAHFADGIVHIFGPDLRTLTRVYTPTFTGEPLEELVRLTGSCFFGSSWLIRWEPNMQVRFNEEISHAEDLLFLLSIAAGKRYVHVDDVVYNYRVTGHSSMSNIDGLARSYRYLHHWMVRNLPQVGQEALSTYQRKTKRIIVASYIKAGHYLKALGALLS
jgi:hypothetical protein